MGLVNGLLGIRIVTPESLERAKRAHPHGREHRCPAGPSSSNRRTEGDSIRRASRGSENPLEREREREESWLQLIFYLQCSTQKCWPRLPSSRNPRRCRKSHTRDICAMIAPNRVRSRKCYPRPSWKCGTVAVKRGILRREVIRVRHRSPSVKFSRLSSDGLFWGPPF